MWPFSTKQAVETAAITVDETKATSGTSIPADWLMELFGAGVAGSGPVSAATALTVPAVASAVRVISEAAASLEIKVKRNGKEARHPAGKLLAGDVNEWLSGFELVRDLVAEALTSDHGGFAYVNRVDGKVVEILKYDPGNISVQYEKTGEPVYHLDGRRVAAEDIIHVRGPFDRCPLTLARRAISAAYHMESHATNLWQFGARPGGVLESPKPVGDLGVRAMIAGWKAAHEGSASGGKTAVLFDGVTFKPLTLNSTDSQFLENRKFQIIEIARAFRVPPSMLFELDRATWSNSEQMGREFLVYTLEPHLKAVEGALRRALFTAKERETWTIEFDRDDLTRASLAERATAYSSLISSRIYSPNELRAWEGADPYAGGDEYLNPAISPANDNPPPHAQEAA